MSLGKSRVLLVESGVGHANRNIEMETMETTVCYEGNVQGTLARQTSVCVAFILSLSKRSRRRWGIIHRRNVSAIVDDSSSYLYYVVDNDFKLWIILQS